MLKTAVIGPGRWGTTNAWILSDISEKVFLFGESDDKDFINLKEKRENDYLKLKDNIFLENDLKAVLDFASDFVCVAINGQNTREFFTKYKKEFFDYKGDVILMMKSIEKETGLRLSQVYEEVVDRTNLSVIVGPAHPQEIVRGMPTAMIVSGINDEVVKRIIEKFKHKLYRLYWNHDLVGVEIGAALKNTIGIIAGILVGLDMQSLLGVLITRGPLEVSHLIEKKGGKWKTCFGLSHIGDYAATVFSHYSHNFQYGESLALGKEWEESKVAEGAETILALEKLTNNFKEIEMPLHHALFNVIVNGYDIKEELKKLFDRPQREEFYN